MQRRGVAAVVAPLVTAAFALALTVLLVGCIATPAPDSPTTHLPLGIPEPLVASCEQSAGLGGSAPVTEVWRDSQGLHVRIGRTSESSRSAQTGALSATELALLTCLKVVVGNQPNYPADSAGLLLLWKYSTTVLWPCFVAHDANIGPVPSRADFLRGDPLQIDPLYLVKSPLSDVQSLELQRDCPLIPSYLASPTPTPRSTLFSGFAPDATSTG